LCLKGHGAETPFVALASSVEHLAMSIPGGEVAV
jgi:hypothetical protein